MPRNEKWMQAMQEKARSSVSRPFRNKAKYDRKRDKKNWRKDF